MTTTRAAQVHRLTGFSLHGASVCRRAPHPFWTIIAFRVMWWSSAYLWSDPAVRFPPRCHSDLSKTHTADMVRGHAGVIMCLRKSSFAISLNYSSQWIEFFTLTSHPKTPDRTAAEAGRHVSRNIHNTGNFAASREETDNRGCREGADLRSAGCAFNPL